MTIEEIKRALVETAIVCAQHRCFDCPFADNIGCTIKRPKHWRIFPSEKLEEDTHETDC